MFNREISKYVLNLSRTSPSGDIPIISSDKIVIGGSISKDKKTYIYFGGTISTYGWIRNFFFDKKVIPYNNQNTQIRIHHGFLEAYLSIRQQVHNVIKILGNTNIIISGFSLGGAIATLCAVDIQYNFPEIGFIDCYILGAPRVGNSQFVESYNKRVPNTYRIINGKDIATKLPPFIFNYEHVATKENIIKIGKNEWWKDFSVKDHNWDYYTDGLNNLD